MSGKVDICQLVEGRPRTAHYIEFLYLAVVDIRLKSNILLIKGKKRQSHQKRKVTADYRPRTLRS